MRKLLVLAALGTAVFGAVQAAPLMAQVVPGPAGDADNGKKLVRKFACRSCHSLSGGAGVGPSLQGVTKRLTQEQISRQVTQPPVGSIMPASNLTKSEIRDLIAFLEKQ